MREAENIRQLVQLSVDYIGFIFYGKSARFVSEKPLVDIPSSVKKVGVFVNETLENIFETAREHQLQVVQLHGQENPAIAQTLRAEGLEIWKAFGIDEHFDWLSVGPYLDVVDYFLFDTKSPQHGGTGQVFDWHKLQEYSFDKPYFLSGGLSLENIAEASAFEDERLVGLDLNSKFEVEPGLKNIESLTQALKIIRK